MLDKIKSKYLSSTDTLDEYVKEFDTKMKETLSKWGF